jgi:hypothetical protein
MELLEEMLPKMLMPGNNIGVKRGYDESASQSPVDSVPLVLMSPCKRRGRVSKEDDLDPDLNDGDVLLPCVQDFEHLRPAKYMLGMGAGWLDLATQSVAWVRKKMPFAQCAHSH